MNELTNTKKQSENRSIYCWNSSWQNSVAVALRKGYVLAIRRNLATRYQLKLIMIGPKGVGKMRLLGPCGKIVNMGFCKS